MRPYTDAERLEIERGVTESRKANANRLHARCSKHNTTFLVDHGCAVDGCVGGDWITIECPRDGRDGFCKHGS